MRSEEDALIDEIEQWAREERAAFAEPIESRQRKALEMKAAGITPSCSTGIHDYITYGYGILDQFGFWQYPLPDGEYVGDHAGALRGMPEEGGENNR